jgi:hypothetical protein
MKSAYRIFGYLIAMEVAVQAAAIAYASFGVGKFIDDGGTLDKSVVEADDLPFDEVVGFTVHGINGQFVIPLLALILLIVSIFAKVPRGVQWAAGILVIVVVQVVLGILAHDVTWLGLLHGINAILLAAIASTAASRVDTPVATPAAPA